MEKKSGTNRWNWISVALSAPYTWVGVAVVLTVVWAGLKGWWESPYAPLLVPVLVLVVGLTFFSVNQLGVFRDRHRKGFARRSNADIVAILRKWFDKRHYSSSETTDNEALFRIVATDDRNRKLIVFRPKGNPSVICIYLIINEEQIALIPQPHQNAARFDVTMEMARMGLLFQGGTPMRISQELQCDDFLTESNFWNAIDKIRQGHYLIVAHFNLALAALAVARIEKQTPSTIEQVPDKGGSQT